MSKILKLDPNYAARIKELHTLLEISNLVGSVMELDDILSAITETTAKHLNVKVCSIYLLTEDKQELVLRATFGLNPAVVGRARFKLGEGIPGWVVKSGEIVSLTDCYSDKRHKPIPGSDEEPCHAYLCVPLRIQEEIIGAMTSRKVEIYEYSIAEKTLFETIAKQVAIVIEKSRLYFSKIQAERTAAIGVSLSEIAHYIKNLIQSMKGGSYFIETGLKRGEIEKALNGWNILRRSNKKIAYLVENMLNFSRTIKSDLEPESINEIVIELLNSAEDTVQERGINIKVNLQPEIPNVLIDHERIYDVLLNLVTNAIDAIPEGEKGTITLTTSHNPAKEKIYIQVEDTGTGIPSEILPKIFNLFFSTKGAKGTGIGLAVSKKIVEEHGGEIKVESELGKGTRFIIELPQKAPIIP